MSAQKDPARYPFAGTRYLLSHPKLLSGVICYVIIGIIFALAALIILLAAALKPQAEAFGGEVLGWLLGTIAVFVEAFIIAMIFMKLMVSKAQEQLFVSVMKLEGCWNDGWEEPTMLSNLICCCNTTLLLQMVTLPINLLPVVGTMLYVALNAPLASWDLMSLYYDSIGMNEVEQKRKVVGKGCEKINPNTFFGDAHFRFGMSATFVELVPLLGPTLFTLGNACAAALWSCDIEKEKKRGEEERGLTGAV
ncbi:hypothetical protein TrLO_g5281 [Triparma laevis f. longispina]|uniref:Uncharacterized protein n=1 Tax=Triparma laevis f. longispina TaxID=1714387 RepID=A0A9W7FCI1_9STRA|nr:hypothetical protein TrLO_g5281 [Triparma laevis f. longispina]